MAAFTDAFIVLAQMYNAHHTVLRFVRLGNRSDEWLPHGQPQKGLYGCMSLRHSIDVVRVASERLSHTGRLSVLDIAAFPGSAEFGLVRLFADYTTCVACGCVCVCVCVCVW